MTNPEPSRRSLLAGLAATAVAPWDRILDLRTADLIDSNLHFAPLTTLVPAIRTDCVMTMPNVR